MLLHSLLETAATRHPRRIAVAQGDEAWTYEHLWRASSNWFNNLPKDLAPEEIIGVSGVRSPRTAAALAGIVVAGCAYLPINPKEPAERIRKMTTDARVRYAVADADSAPWIESLGLKRLTPPSRDAAESASSTTRMPTTISPDGLAYVMFTSGSTGSPKGVMIEHRGAVNTLHDVNERFGIGPEDRTLGISSLSFDLSVFDTFGMWSAGGCTVFPTEAEAGDPAAWLRIVSERQVTVWNSVPALLELLLEQAEKHDDRQALRSLRLVLLSGDWIPLSLPDRLRRRHPDCRVVSLGGATEGSIWSIAYEIDQVDPAWKSIPYGTALSHQSMQVVNESGEDCPTNEIGEIVIGGIGVARGYIGRPDLTAARFQPDPLQCRPEERRYRTGDLGRLLPDGNIEFLGRRDQQVKLHGMRVELGEIEEVLRRHNAVEQAAVAMSKSAVGAERLTAFLVARNGNASLEKSLREYAAARLPASMIPTRWQFLSSLPLTSNGKVDRRALAELASAAEAACPYEAPRGERAEQIAAIWREALAVDRVGLHDDFFALGGDSLNAVMLLAELRHRFNYQVQLSDLIRHSCFADFQDFLELGSPEKSAAIRIRAGSDSQRVFFIPCIYSELMTARRLAERLDADCELWGLQARGYDGRETPCRTITELRDHYLDQVRRVQAVGPYLLIGYSLGGLVGVEMARELQRCGQKVEMLVLVDAPCKPRPAWLRAVQGAMSLLRRGTREATPSALFQSHLAAFHAYRPREYSGPTTIARARDPRGGWKQRIDDLLGTFAWSRYLPRERIYQAIEATHETIFDPPAVDRLAALVNADRAIDCRLSGSIVA